MGLKISKDEQKEIQMIKAHYIAMLDEKDSMNAYTINSVNRLCRLLEIFYALADDIRKRGVNIAYNNGGGQTGNKQNESIKLLEVFENNIERLKKEIEKYNDENIKQIAWYTGNTINYDFRKYEQYFSDNQLNDSEKLYKELSIKSFCNKNNISSNIADEYIKQLRADRITYEEVNIKLQEMADELQEQQELEEYE